MKRLLALTLICLLLAMPVLAWNWMEEDDEFILLLKSTPSTGASYIIVEAGYVLVGGEKINVH